MIRKLTALLTAMAAAAMTALAGVYAPADVPNVHVADHTRNISNPDGIISAGAQTLVDSIVAQLRAATSAEMQVVVVDDINNPDDIDRFATELFSLWGLGKKDRDNGVLLLVAKNRRKATIRTGYGAEGVLPDIVCGSILRDKMFPAFRKGDFDGGVVAATRTIAELLSDPDAAAELQSRLKDADRRESTDFFGVYLS
ncbi:MAG: TPM domain-containing protein, partial [Muribaculaceae bacterium]|nr:TPM domain-containing protein [Muribaculaceae bacterium]